MIRIFIGTDSDIHADAEKVVEYSIRKHTTEEVEINFIRPGWKSGVTGFTNHRFLVPKLCNYEGYAIYLDVDMLILGDIAEVWNCKQPGKWCTTGLRDDVSVIDCSAFRFLTEEYVKTHRKDYIRSYLPQSPLISNHWNVVDRMDESTKLVHYSNLDTQPWRDPHPDQALSNLFFQYLDEANNAL